MESTLTTDIKCCRALPKPHCRWPELVSGASSPEMSSWGYCIPKLHHHSATPVFALKKLQTFAQVTTKERGKEGRARVSALVGVTCGGMASFAGVHLHHVARETDDVERLVKFYQEVFGFEKIETPDFGLKVVWLRLPPSYALHIIQRDTKTCLPESPFSAVELARKEESALPNGHHLCFSITDYPGAIQVLKEKKIPYFEKFLLGGKVRQVFFFDPDGNGLELADWPPETHQLAC